MVMQMDERFRRCFIISRTSNDNRTVQIELNEINITRKFADFEETKKIRRDEHTCTIYTHDDWISFNEKLKVFKPLYSISVR